MARNTSLLVTHLFIFFIAIFNLYGIFSFTVDHSGAPPMIFPLFHSPPNTSANSGHLFRRNLLNHTSTARMRLYDNLFTNGYYTTRLWIGTPPQEFALIVDTGSTVTYVPCSTCVKCGKHQDPKFEPELSSSYEPVKCSANCNCNAERTQCSYERQYAEMSSSSGVLGNDIISFGNESELAPQRAVFGCENVETGDLYRQRADGIIGLGRGRLSIIDQLVDQGVISDSFSLCYGGMVLGGGAMVLGRIVPPSDMVFADSDPYRSPYYNIDLKEIQVAGKALDLSPNIFNGKHGTVLDSGTTYAYLPEKAFVTFKIALMKEAISLKQIPGVDSNYKDLCFSGAGRDISQLSKSFPEVNMVFANGQKISLSPENYLFRHLKVRGAYCLGIFQNGKDPTTLLGGIVVRNTLVTYDRENDKIGFWKTNCSQLWKIQHISKPPAPAPVPVASSGNKSTMGMPSALSPSGATQTISIGKFKIWSITFDMSFNINYSSMGINVTEITVFIAHGLKINLSQVHLLNMTSNGNSSLIRWAIYPAKYTNSISNTAAMGIISRLTEQRLSLPVKFGSYQLLQWSVQPQNQTWWRQHAVVLAAGVIISLLFALVTFAISYIWRHRRETLGSYKPVGDNVPEQELQPL